MTALRTVIPLRATMLMDAPEGAVRRALGRADVWTRTARAMGGRGDVAGPRSSPPRMGPRAPLRDGDLIRLWVNRSEGSVAGSRGARREATGGAAGESPRCRSRSHPGEWWPPRSLIFRVVLDADRAGAAQPNRSRRPPALPMLELVAGPLKSCRITLTTACTAAGTLVTLDCRARAEPALLTPLLRRRILESAQLLLGIAMLTAREVRVVVAGAVIENGTVLVARRTAPPDLAGRWELPGGKVEPGEAERDALARELAEELGIVVTVGERIGGDVDVDDDTILRCYRADISAGRPVPAEHDAVRWVGVDELDGVDWLPSDREVLTELRASLLLG